MIRLNLIKETGHDWFEQGYVWTCSKCGGNVPRKTYFGKSKSGNPGDHVIKFSNTKPSPSIGILKQTIEGKWVQENISCDEVVVRQIQKE